MKNILFIIALTFTHYFGLSAQMGKLDALFNKYQETDGVTSIKISKPMFGMLGGLNIQDSELEQIKPLLKKMNGLKILILEKSETQNNPASEDEKQMNLYQNLSLEISDAIKNMDLQELMTVNSKGNKIKLLSSDAVNGVFNNLLLSINAEDNTVLMILDGKITMEDVNRLIDESQEFSPQKNSATAENISNEGIVQARNVGEFIGVEVSNGIRVNFTQGEKQSVVVDAEGNNQQYVYTEVEKGILKVFLKTGGLRNIRFKKLNVNIVAPHLQKILTDSGASFYTLNKVSEENIEIVTNSGSSINGDFKANEISVEGTSGSSQKLKITSKKFNFSGTSGMSAVIDGSAESAIFKTSSASSCNAQNLVAKNVVVSSTSASTVKVHATESMTANTTSAGDIRYNGKPERLSVSNSGGGSTKPIN